MEDIIYIARLFDVYGELLNERQREIMRMRIVYDYSLTEIGEVLNISRQAVHDAEKKSVDALKNYEDVLSIIKKQDACKEIILDLRKRITSLNIDKDSEKITLDKLDELEEEIG